MQLHGLTIVRDVIYEEGGLPAVAPATRVAACAVIANPYAGQAAEDLGILIAVGAELGHTLTKEALAQLPGRPLAYGKAAIIGVNGDIEHAAADGKVDSRACKIVGCLTSRAAQCDCHGPSGKLGSAA